MHLSQDRPGAFRWLFSEASRPKRASSAFSLVEIALALGVISFAFVALMGLLPIGMTLFGNAMSNSVHAQIVQRVISDAEQTDFPTLASAGTIPPRYFDDQGDEVKTQNASIYAVQVSVQASSKLPEGEVTQNLLTVQIKTVKDPGHSKDPFASTKLPSWNDVTFIARNENK